MARYSREEIEHAFAIYQDKGLEAARSGDWSLWGDMFTEDCSYYEHSLGQWGGREAVTREMAALMTKTEGTPWIWCNQYPVNDYVIDVERGWVWSLIWNRMEDPGNGLVYQCNCLTLLYYAGNGMFSYEEDLYNPRQFQKMMADWLAMRDQCEQRGDAYGQQRKKNSEHARSVAIEAGTSAPTFSNVRPEHLKADAIQVPQGRFTEAEIENAFEKYRAGLAKAGRTNDWRHWGNCLTTDTTVIDCELGHLGKRDAVVERVEAELHQADPERPWEYLNHFPVDDYIIDPQRDTVWAFFWARFRDPGEGSRHEAKVFVRLVYDGDGLFKEIETLYNPDTVEAAMKSWIVAQAAYDVRRERRAKRLAEREATAMAAAPLKLDEHGKEVKS